MIHAQAINDSDEKIGDVHPHCQLLGLSPPMIDVLEGINRSDLEYGLPSFEMTKLSCRRKHTFRRQLRCNNEWKQFMVR
jgi:hypothetical protein